MMENLLDQARFSANMSRESHGCGNMDKPHELGRRPDGSGIDTEGLSHVSRFGASRELKYQHVPCSVSHMEYSL